MSAFTFPTSIRVVTISVGRFASFKRLPQFVRLLFLILCWSTTLWTSHVLALTATTSTLALSASSVKAGQDTVLTATVSPSAAKGTVTFKDGTATLGTGTLSAGKAKLTTAFTSLGAHSLTAVYGGSGSHATSMSAAKSQTVTAITTATVLSASPTTVYKGQAAILTATVSPAAASGTITFKDGSTTLGTGTLSAGVATLSTSFGTAGSHSLTAVYAATGSYAASTSAAVTETVTLSATTTGLTASATKVAVGQATVLTATVAPPTATGTVTFKDGTITLGTGTLSSGTATLSSSFGAAGTHNLTAVYAGSASYATSTSAVLSATVEALTATSTVLTVPGAAVAAGQALTLSATVSPSAATGTVTFKDGTTTLGTSTLSAGTATLSTSFGTIGAHSLTAVYGGSTSHASSISSVVNKTIGAAATTLSLSATPTSATVNQATSLKATISPAVASGSITFKDGATTLGTASLSAGVATLSFTFATAGLHTLTANYAANASFGASTSNALSLAVNGAPGVIPAAPNSPAPVVGFAYDAQGNPTAVIQAPDVADYGFTTSTSYDALSRPYTITDPLNGSTLLIHDGGDRLILVSDPRGLATQYQRDGFGQNTQLVSPDTGTAGMTYDAAGNLLSRTDSRGVLASHAYDALNRRTSSTLSQSGQPNQSYTWTYDETGGMFSNGIGRLTSIIFPEGSASYAYDAQGRLTQSRQILNSNASANPQPIVQYTSYGYDAAGHLTSLTYPSGRQLTLSYIGGLPSGMGLANDSLSAAAPLLSSLQYAPFGGPQSWNWAMASGPQAHIRSLDTSGRLVRYPLGEYLRDISYDAANRITAYTHYVAATGGAAPAQDQQFGYDALNRLTQASTAQATWAYTYDANGNRTSVAINNGAPSPYTIDSASNRLNAIATPPITLAYDQAGNTTSDGNFTLAYELRGRLASISQMGETTRYSYDNVGQRVRKSNGTSAGTEVFAYDPQGHLLGEYDGTGQPIREYVWLDDMPVAVFMPDPAYGANAGASPPLVYYIHADHLNTPRVVVDRNNAVRWRWLAEPFGTTAAESSPTGQTPLTFNLRFPGQFYDVESGIHYNMHRDYIPGIGRYAQSDPIGLQGGINTFAYVAGNPLSFVDANGLQSTGSGFPNIEGEFRRYQDALIDAYVNVAAFAAGEGVFAGAWRAVNIWRASKAAEVVGQELGRKSATYVGGYKDGQVVVGRSSNPLGCAEDDVARQLGANADMTKAFGWRRNPATGNLDWTEIPVCIRCQAKYSPTQFPRDVNAAPGGAWGK